MKDASGLAVEVMLDDDGSVGLRDIRAVVGNNSVTGLRYSVGGHGALRAVKTAETEGPIKFLPPRSTWNTDALFVPIIPVSTVTEGKKKFTIKCT